MYVNYFLIFSTLAVLSPSCYLRSYLLPIYTYIVLLYPRQQITLTQIRASVGVTDGAVVFAFICGSEVTFSIDGSRRIVRSCAQETGTELVINCSPRLCSVGEIRSYIGFSSNPVFSETRTTFSQDLHVHECPRIYHDPLHSLPGVC